VGAKVDGIRVPLWTRLKNGQSVEIITAEGQRPQPSWADMAITGKAKSAIRRSLREDDRESFVRLGRELARVGFDHVGKRATEKALATAAKRLAIPDAEELLARLGAAEITAREVVDVVYPELARAPAGSVDRDRAVVGLSQGQSFHRGACCRPVPGERIVGLTQRGKGVVVHAIDCAALAAEDASDDWMDLRWHEGPHAPVHEVPLELTISNDAGVLGRICTLIGEQKANISDLVFIDRKPDYYRLRVDVELSDVEHLHRVMTAVEADTDVAGIQRHRAPLSSRRPVVAS
jgi:(p)ppGpp synthase/HD superfamily hydrolase